MGLPVSTCGVLVRGLLLAAQAVVGTASLCAPHNSAWEVSSPPTAKSRQDIAQFFHYSMYFYMNQWKNM